MEISMMHSMFSYFNEFVENQKMMQTEFKSRAEKAKQKYWDAALLPRKEKKRVRKEALANFLAYSQIVKWNEEYFPIKSTTNEKA